jgi:hypothetical protein
MNGETTQLEHCVVHPTRGTIHMRLDRLDT